MGITSINGQNISASAVAVFDNTTGVGPYYPLFVPLSAGSQPLYVDSSGLTYNATSNTLTATTFAGTASAANRVDVGQGSGNATNYLIFTPQFNAGGTNPAAVTQSSNVTYNPSTLEFRGGLVNCTANGSKVWTSDANLTIDASLTQSMTWIASLTATRSLNVINLTDGRVVNVWIRNTNATQRQIIFSGSSGATGQAISMSAGGTGAASITTQNIAANTGTLFANIRTISATTFGTLT